MARPFERVLIVMFENQYRSYVLKDPFMRKLAAAGCEMSNYFGAFHPSQTNYVASLAGELCAVTNDTPPASPLMQNTLVDLMQPAGGPAKASWKAYMEAYPGEPWKAVWKQPSYPASDQPLNEFPTTGGELARYYRKHNAFASFHTIQADPRRWSRVVGDVAFWDDVEAETWPDYGWFTPDIWNDGHYLYNTHVDTNPRVPLVSQCAGWLEYVFLGTIAAGDVRGGEAYHQRRIGLGLDIDLLLTDPDEAYGQSRIPAGTLLVVTFDEADYDAIGYDTNYDGPNQIYTVLLGDIIEPGTTCPTPFNHYSLIKTVEKNFDLGSLGKNDEHANWFRFLWDQSFRWTEPASTGLATPGDAIAAADHDGSTYLLFCGAGGAGVMCSEKAVGRWSDAVATGFETDGPLALASTGDQLIAVFTGDGDGSLYQSVRSAEGWSPARALGFNTGGALAMAGFSDHDGARKLMLAWPSPGDGFIQYLLWQGGEWNRTPGAVGQLTDGALALAQLGPSLYLVYKERNSRKMRMTSYNLALFNAFAALDFAGKPAPANDTTLHRWSPMDFQVGHFAAKFGTIADDYLHSGPLALAAIEGEMHLAHKGVWSDRTAAYTETFGLTGILTAATQETNGWGTLAQSGWTPEVELSGVDVDQAAPMAMASDGGRLILVFRKSGGNELYDCVGEYR